MRFAIAVAALLCATRVWAGDVSVSGAWARATAPGQSSGMVQFVISSQQEASLVGVSSPAAGAAEMHSMTHENGMMKMRPIKALSLPAGKPVDLAASGEHVMLLKLKHPLKEGDTVPLTLTIQFADKHKETVNVKAEIRPLTASSDMHDHDDHHDHH